MSSIRIATKIRAHILLISLLSACQCDDELYRVEDPPREPSEEPRIPVEPPPPAMPPPPAPPPPPPPVDPPDPVCADRAVPSGSVPQDPACEFDPTVGGFEPIVEWVKSDFVIAPDSDQVMMTPIVVPIPHDVDAPVIIFVTYDDYEDQNGVLRAISGSDGHEIWSKVGHDLQPTGGVAAADIDGDGLVEIIACTSDRAKAFNHDGSLLWTSPNIGSHLDGESDGPAISDMDGDGAPEIVIGSVILRADGSIRATGSAGIGSTLFNVGTTSFAVDLDADGIQEVVTGNAAYGPDGEVRWSNGQMDGYVAVGDFDADGLGEVVVSEGRYVRLQDTDGNLLWRVEIPGALFPVYGGPPTVADFDGDGQPEVGVAANSSYTVFDGDGTMLWQMPTQDASSGNTGSSVYDFEGDGIAEAVYADETRLWVFAGPDGAVRLESDDHRSYTWLEYPVIADSDGDGEAEIVIPNNRLGGIFGNIVGISTIGDAGHSWRPGRKIWNQHAYHITNVTDDGRIPTNADLNWLTYNSFRSGDLTPAVGTGAPDLFVEVSEACLDQCESSDELVLWARVGNRGTAPATGTVTINIVAETPGGTVPLESRDIPGVAAGGLTESIRFDLDQLRAMGTTGLILTVDPDDRHEECHETNNEVGWTTVC